MTSAATSEAASIGKKLARSSVCVDTLSHATLTNTLLAPSHRLGDVLGVDLRPMGEEGQRSVGTGKELYTLVVSRIEVRSAMSTMDLASWLASRFRAAFRAS